MREPSIASSAPSSGVAALLGAFAMGSGSVAFVLLLVVAAVLLVTAAVGFCPLYRVFGMSTCRVADELSGSAGDRLDIRGLR